MILAALFYLGAGLGLLAFQIINRNLVLKTFGGEQPIVREDWGLLLGILMTGGMGGPIFMLLGLQRLSAVIGSLLLNLEAVLTVFLAAIIYHEHVGKRVVVAVCVITGGAMILSLHPDELQFDWMGATLIAVACLCWAFDNNLTQRLSHRDPVAIVRTKTLVAGRSLILAIGIGQHLPPPRVIWFALVLGFISYGVSVVLDLYALRILGAAREAAYFATAPFIGAAAAVPFLGETWTMPVMTACVLMGAGITLLVSERHSHPHVHEAIEHNHSHSHGDYHQHDHDNEEEKLEPHGHVHRHLPILHNHPHMPEVHHRHSHDN